MQMLASALSVAILFGAANVALAAKRDASDPRRICRKDIQKSTGQGKDAKVSRKAIDRCVQNGGQI